MKKPSTVVLVLLLVASQMFLPATSRGCSIAPSLWELAGRADAIVVARVVRIEPDEAVPGTRDEEIAGATQTAVLDVQEVWKGSPPSELRVTFQYGAPRDFASAEEVVVFLERGETIARQQREALARWNAPPPPEDATESDDEGDIVDDEDVIVPPETDAEDTEEDTEEVVWTDEDEARREAERERARTDAEEYVRRFEPWANGRWLPMETSWTLRVSWDHDRDRLAELVRRAASLQATGRPVAETDRRAWVIASVDHPATRAEAVWQLFAQRRRLSDDDFSSLAASFVRAPAVDDTDLVMLKIFRGRQDLDVDRAAAAVIEAGVRMPRVPGWVISFVQETLRRYGDDFAARIGRDDRDPGGRPIYTGPGENTLWTIWEVARRDLGIPEVAPAEAPPKPQQQSVDWLD